MPTAPTPHTALPAAPSTNDPANFDTKADTFVAALETFGDQMDALATNAYGNAVEAASSATAAASSATAAATSATTATTKAGEAAASATAAAGSASTAAGWSATSTSSLELTSGSKSITIQTAKQFTAGTNIKVKRTSAPTTTYVHTTVDTYNSGTGVLTFTLTSDLIVGSGTYTDWTIELSGARGATGAGDVNGPAGATNNAVVLYDGTTGKVLKDSAVVIGTSANNLVQLDGSGALPPVSGANLTGLAQPGWNLLASVTASASTSVEFSGYFSSTYDEYVIICGKVTGVTDFAMQVKHSGSYYTSGYTGRGYYVSTGNNIAYFSPTEYCILVYGAYSTSSVNRIEVKISCPAASSIKKVIAAQAWWSGANPSPGMLTSTTVAPETAAITAVRFVGLASESFSGEFRLYGLKK